MATRRSWEAADITNSFDIKLLGTHRRELVPVRGPRNRRLPRGYRDTRGHDRLEVVLTFEGGGGGRLEATAEMIIPQSFEANPLRGASQANGGRCCPHSYFLKFTGDRERPNTKTAAGRSTRSKRCKNKFETTPGRPAEAGTSNGPWRSSVDEAAKPYIHHQANRQENKQRG